LQQIFQQDNHSTVLGGLYQHTDLEIHDVEYAYGSSDFYPGTLYSTNVQMNFERFSAYGYESWQLFDPLLVVGGISYDRITFPRNWNSSPVSNETQSKEQVSPKAGIVWTPGRNTTVRFAYTRSLTGMSLDQSTRIEPTQVAGLNQSYRNVISDSIAGATSGARLETYGLSLEQKFETGTYLGVSGELLYSDVSRLFGSYLNDLDNPANPDYMSVYSPDFKVRERLHSRERSLIVTADQLIDKEWTVGARYRLTQANLNDDFPDVWEDVPLDAIDIYPHKRLESLLHQLNLHVNFNHVSGFFSTFEAVWYLQDNSGFLYRPSTSSGVFWQETDKGDEFWQFNLIGGYRFYHRRAIISAGVLNLTDQNYHLSPLTYYNEMPRERTFVARFQLNF
jgi:outer membrane receptor protein involved in Fe transport